MGQCEHVFGVNTTTSSKRRESDVSHRGPKLANFQDAGNIWPKFRFLLPDTVAMTSTASAPEQR